MVKPPCADEEQGRENSQEPRSDLNLTGVLPSNGSGQISVGRTPSTGQVEALAATQPDAASEVLHTQPAPDPHQAALTVIVQRLQEHGYAANAETAAVNKSLKWSPVIAGAALLLFGPAGLVSAATYNAHAGRIAGLERHLSELQSHTPLILYKFSLGSPEILALVDGDGLCDSELLALSAAFDEGLLKASKYSPSNGCTTGRLLVLFWDQQRCNRFTEAMHERCCVAHFWKRVNLWVTAVDMVARSVRTRKGLKLLGFLNTIGDTSLASQVFGS